MSCLNAENGLTSSTVRALNAAYVERISEALKAGRVVPGARLSRGKHVRLR